MPTKLSVPIPEAQIRQLRIGDQVLLSGVIFTGRDAAHKYMKETFIAGPCPASEKPLYDILRKGLAGGVIYHCGPVVKKGSAGVPPASGSAGVSPDRSGRAPHRPCDAGLPPRRAGSGPALQGSAGVSPDRSGRAPHRPCDAELPPRRAGSGPALQGSAGVPPAGVAPAERYEFVAAGPTTSIREEPYEAAVIEHFGLRAVIGKGGMGARTLEACGKFGAVYLHAIGGAATLIAESVKEVVAVHKLEFGVPEAFWQIRVEDFPCVVTMDSHGASLHDKVREDSQRKLKALLAS